MKKINNIFLAILTGGILLTGCSNKVINSEKENESSRINKTLTYEVETGDKIEISLNTSEGYNIDSKVPFSISKNDETISQGTFIQEKYYEEYLNAVKTDNTAEILDTGVKSGNEYLFWEYDDTEWNYVMKIGDSNTALLIASDVSESDARDVFNLLEIRKLTE